MNAVRVEVDVYSGRPNPTWNLSSEDVSAFFRRLDALPRIPKGAQQSTGQEDLGYRGLKVEATKKCLNIHIEISRGTVVIRRSHSAPESRFSDPHRLLEKWLLETGREYIDADLLRYLELQIGGDSAGQ